MTDQDSSGRRRAHVGAKARVSVQRAANSSEAVVRFEDADGVLCVSMALEVFPRLVDMLQFAALSPAPPVPEDVPPPWACDALVVRKALGEGDGS